MRDYKDLKRFAEYFDFTVTSTTGGKHNVGSKHALGLAVDLMTRDKSNAEITRFLLACVRLGVRVRDERIRPNKQRVWSGAHLHLEITSETLLTVIEFQKRYNLIADGIAGTQTLNALKSSVV